MPSDPRVAIVVPWRSGDADRERAREWTRGWWEQFGWPIFEVEHPAPDPFNRSWCINEGARRAWPWDILIAIDADVFCEDPEQVRRGVESAWHTGRLTVPHIEGADLNALGTATLVRGDKGWQTMTSARRDPCTSRVTIVRADLFERVGGFDERFQGWGHEDIAFWVSTICVGGVDQLPGTTWHLWHRPSLPVAKKTKEWRDGQRLADRYQVALLNGWVAIERLLNERPQSGLFDPNRTKSLPVPGPLVDVICLTAGRRRYLERTIASFEDKVNGRIGRRTLFDDSGDAVYGGWLRRKYPKWQIVTTKGRVGFTEAIRVAWGHESKTPGAPYIFHLEEDFVFDREVYLDDMIAVLESDPLLIQTALLRGPFFPPEIKAGGIVQEDPAAYESRNGTAPAHLVHQKYFTTNPCIYRRTLIRGGWPRIKDSESVFTKRQVQKRKAFALMGNGEPWITHIGVERTGRGY